MKKTAGIIALLLVMVLVLSACGKDDSKSSSSSSSNSIEGTWVLTDVESSSMDKDQIEQAKQLLKTGDMQQTAVLKDGRGTWHIVSYGQSYEYGIEYKIDGNKITMTDDDTKETHTLDFKVDSNKLELTLNGTTEIYTRK